MGEIGFSLEMKNKYSLNEHVTQGKIVLISPWIQLMTADLMESWFDD